MTHQRETDRRRQLDSGNRLALLIVAGIALLWVLQAFASDPRMAVLTRSKFFSISFEQPEDPVPGTRRSVLTTWNELSAANAKAERGAHAVPDAHTTDLETDRAVGTERNSVMSNVTGYVSSLFLSIGIAVVVALVLRRPLGGLLLELCGNERRAAFWAAFSSVALVLGSLLGALLSIPASGEAAWEGAAGLRALLVGLRSSTFLLLTVISVMGFVMLVGISRAPVAKPRGDEGWASQ